MERSCVVSVREKIKKLGRSRQVHSGWRRQAEAQMTLVRFGTRGSTWTNGNLGEEPLR